VVILVAGLAAAAGFDRWPLGLVAVGMSVAIIALGLVVAWSGQRHDRDGAPARPAGGAVASLKVRRAARAGRFPGGPAGLALRQLRTAPVSLLVTALGLGVSIVTLAVALHAVHTADDQLSVSLLGAYLSRQTLALHAGLIALILLGSQLALAASGASEHAARHRYVTALSALGWTATAIRRTLLTERAIQAGIGALAAGLVAAWLGVAVIPTSWLAALVAGSYLIYLAAQTLAIHRTIRAETSAHP
jgi:hypothetical protein